MVDRLPTVRKIDCYEEYSDTDKTCDTQGGHLVFGVDDTPHTCSLGGRRD